MKTDAEIVKYITDLYNSKYFDIRTILDKNIVKVISNIDKKVYSVQAPDFIAGVMDVASPAEVGVVLKMIAVE